MSTLTFDTVHLLLRGASILACGGGLPFTDQQKLISTPKLKTALKKGILLLDPSELEDEEWFVTVSEVGSADAPVMEKSALPQALQLLQEKTGKKVRGLIPGEIGQEAITLESAAVLGLPVVNSDLSGCRAVPRLTHLSLVVQGVPFTMSPMVVMSNDGEAKFFQQAKSLEADESTVRKLVPKGDVVTMLGGMITGKMIKEFLSYRSYSVAIEIAHSLSNSGKLSSVFPTPLLLGPLSGRILALEEKNSSGFNEKEIVFEHKRGTGKITVENEYMQLMIDGKIFRFPQLIMLIDPQSKRGLHSSEIQSRMEVTVVVADAFSFWKGKKV